MPRQRAIRFPDDLHDAIEAEAQRLGHPHTFSSVIINGMRGVVADRARLEADRSAIAGVLASSSGRGSPSPSLERAKRSIT